MPTSVNTGVVIAWVILLLILAVFSVHWFWAFYRQGTDNPNPMTPGFMLREFAFANLFICFACILILYLIGYSVISPLVWGAVSTLGVVGSYILLHIELRRQKRKGKR